MSIKTPNGWLAASDKEARQTRRGDIVRLGRPGTLAVALAVLAFMLVACGRGPDTTVELIYESLGGRQALAEMTSLSLRATGSTTVHSEARINSALRGTHHRRTDNSQYI